MGRLEKQIIIGALALVGVLLGVVVVKGLEPRDTVDARQPLFISLDDPTEEPSAGVEKPRQQEVFPDFGSKTKLKAQDLVPAKQDRVGQPTSVRKPKMDQPQIYTIRPNDTLSEIAQDQLGSQRRMSEILDANPGLDANHLVPGEKLVLPDRTAAAVVAHSKKGSGTVREANSGARTHTVSAGDSLWSLAEKYYGQGYKVDRIVSANPKLLKDKNTVLNIGWVLSIPK
ncbi:MAG: LysM domain-containing protein [Planctomycetota bacterium]